MDNQPPTRCTAFEGSRRITSGELAQVALRAKEVVDQSKFAAVLIFDDATGEQIEVDFRGTAEDVLRRLKEATGERAPTAAAAPRGPGRPKLGVVAREVTLLPRHWDWLNGQPGGASVALRKLVEVARKANEGQDLVRRSQEAAYRFMAALAGDLPGFEEATRALYRGNRPRFDELVAPWPADVRDHARKLAAVALQGPAVDPEPRPVPTGGTA
jgi:hypothetical protein